MVRGLRVRRNLGTPHGPHVMLAFTFTVALDCETQSFDLGTCFTYCWVIEAKSGDVGKETRMVNWCSHRLVQCWELVDASTVG
jgi:hypothetical protein